MGKGLIEKVREWEPCSPGNVGSELNHRISASREVSRSFDQGVGTRVGVPSDFCTMIVQYQASAA